MGTKKTEELIKEYAELKDQLDMQKELVEVTRQKRIKQMIQMGQAHLVVNDKDQVLTADLSNREYANCFDPAGFYDALQNGDKRNFKYCVKVSMPQAFKLLKATADLKDKYWDVEIRPTLTVKKKTVG